MSNQQNRHDFNFFSFDPFFDEADHKFNMIRSDFYQDQEMIENNEAMDNFLNRAQKNLTHSFAKMPSYFKRDMDKASPKISDMLYTYEEDQC